MVHHHEVPTVRSPLNVAETSVTRVTMSSGAAERGDSGTAAAQGWVEAALDFSILGPERRKVLGHPVPTSVLLTTSWNVAREHNVDVFPEVHT